MCLSKTDIYFQLENKRKTIDIFSIRKYDKLRTVSTITKNSSLKHHHFHQFIKVTLGNLTFVFY